MKTKQDKNKIDYEGIALFTIAKQHYKIVEKNQDALKEHLSKKYKEDSIDNWLFQAIMEYETFDWLIKKLEEDK